MPTRRVLLAAACTVLALTACANDGGDLESAEPTEQTDGRGAEQSTDPDAPALDPMPPFDTGEIALTGPGGERVEMAVYVADDDATRRQGLMGVQDLPREAGMVFLFTEDRHGGFWMKNTLIPLSIAYFDADGAVVSVLDMEPCEADPCPTYDPDATYQGALEVNQGYFDELGLDERWQVEVPAEVAG